MSAINMEEVIIQGSNTEFEEKQKVIEMANLPKPSFNGFGDQRDIPFEVFLLAPVKTSKLTMSVSEEREPTQPILVRRLHKLESEKYALRKVLFIQLHKTKDEESFVAKVPSLEMFGMGDTEDEAIEDFQFSLIEDYEILAEEEDKLGNDLRKHLHYLRTVIREV